VFERHPGRLVLLHRLAMLFEKPEIYPILFL